MTSHHENLFKSIVTGMAANTLEQLMQILERDGYELQPLAVSINGEETGAMEIGALIERLREISNEFRPVVMETTRKET